MHAGCAAYSARAVHRLLQEVRNDAKETDKKACARRLLAAPCGGDALGRERDGAGKGRPLGAARAARRRDRPCACAPGARRGGERRAERADLACAAHDAAAARERRGDRAGVVERAGAAAGRSVRQHGRGAGRRGNGAFPAPAAGRGDGDGERRGGAHAEALRPRRVHGVRQCVHQ